MRITIRDVQRVVNKVYNTNVAEVCNDQDVLYFRMHFGDYHCAVYIGLYDKYPDNPNASKQNLELTFIPVDEEGADLVYHNRTFVDMLMLSNELQRVVDWSAVSVCEDTDGSTIISFGRNINTSRNDLKRAFAGDPESELGTALHMLSTEFIVVAPVIHNFARGTTSLEHTKLLLQKPQTQARM